MNITRAGVSEVQIRYKVPTLVWLRLRWVCRRDGLEMRRAVITALTAGLTQLGAPSEIGELLDLEGLRSGPWWQEGIDG